jgi:uncharacterized protein
MTRLHRMSLGTLEFMLHPSGAAYAPDVRTLLAADLHLEQGTSLARRGVHVPPFDTGVTLTLLESVVREMKPWRLILLGDSFHDNAGPREIEPALHERLLALTGAVETVWISGNHDPASHTHLGGVCVGEHVLEGIHLRHEPSRPVAGLEIAGHLHPGASIVHRGVSTRTKCFVADHRRMILPAFGSYTGALSVRSRAYDGLLDDETGQVWMIGASAMHRFPIARVN